MRFMAHGNDRISPQRRARLWKLFGRAATTFAPVGDASARSRRPWSKGSCRAAADPQGRPHGVGARVKTRWRRHARTVAIGRARWSRSPASPCGGRGGGREQRALGPSQRRLCGPSGWSTCPGPPRRLPAGTCPPPTAGGGAPLPPPGRVGAPGCAARAGAQRPRLAERPHDAVRWAGAARGVGPLGWRPEDDHRPLGGRRGVRRVAPGLPRDGGAGAGPEGLCGRAVAHDVASARPRRRPVVGGPATAPAPTSAPGAQHRGLTGLCVPRAGGHHVLGRVQQQQGGTHGLPPHGKTDAAMNARQPALTPVLQTRATRTVRRSPPFLPRRSSRNSLTVCLMC